MCLIHPPSQSSSICWLCHSVFVIWLPPLFPSPLLRPPGGADIELVYMIDLPLFENDPSLRCRSDSLFCAVTALWLMTHHLMCLNLLVVLWCLCWFWMCGPPPRTWLDPLAALHLLLPVWHPVHPDWSGTRSWPSNPEETIWGTGNDKCLASSTVRAADVFSLPARRCASRCYARLLCQLVFIPCELALRHSSDYLGTGPGLFLNTPIIFVTTIRWSKS